MGFGSVLLARPSQQVSSHRADRSCEAFLAYLRGTIVDIGIADASDNGRTDEKVDAKAIYVKIILHEIFLRDTYFRIQQRAPV